jgi:hypothetical protein
MDDEPVLELFCVRRVWNPFSLLGSCSSLFLPSLFSSSLRFSILYFFDNLYTEVLTTVKFVVSYLLSNNSSTSRIKFKNRNHRKQPVPQNKTKQKQKQDV